MIARAIADIRPQDLDELVLAARPEGRTLDYKADLPGPTDEEKRKFLADVAAFANTRGGDIVYGIRESASGGIAESVIGVTTASRDQELLRLEGIIRSGLDPRPQGIEMRWIPHPTTDRQTLIVRVPRSVLGPHMMTFGGLSRFYGRATNGNFLMDVRDIRARTVTLTRGLGVVAGVAEEADAGRVAHRAELTALALPERRVVIQLEPPGREVPSRLALRVEHRRSAW